MGLIFEDILGIFAKEPIAGQVKTRLARDTSADWAQRVAEAFLADSLGRFCSIPTLRVIAYAPSNARTELSIPFRHWVGFYLRYPQSDGDLGHRLRAFFQHYLRDFPRVVVIGTDSPTLPHDYIHQAFAALHQHDVVLGPAFDGGYYLIGCRREIPALFDDIPWSTAKVLDATVQRVHESNASLALLPPWYDVDTVEDWAMLCGHVRAMRCAGVDPEVPRIEELMGEGETTPGNRCAHPGA
jgi:rSAM/selenodomain-associated transferase 1